MSNESHAFVIKSLTGLDWRTGRFKCESTFSFRSSMSSISELTFLLELLEMDFLRSYFNLFILVLSNFAKFGSSIILDICSFGFSTIVSILDYKISNKVDNLDFNDEN